MRSSGLRREACSRCSSRNPVSLPMLHLRCGRHAWRLIGSVVSSFRRSGARHSQNALVLVRKDLDELGLRIGPVFQNPRGAGAAGKIAMAFQQAADFFNVCGFDEGLEIDTRLVATARAEVALIVVDVGNAAA